MTRTQIESTCADLQAKIKQARSKGECTEELLIELDRLVDKLLSMYPVVVCTCER